MTELFDQLQDLLGDTYRLERELTGGMSRVFVAEEIDLGRKVVIKVLPPETVAAVNVARFRREIQLAASLQHPHIVPLLTAGSKGDLLYYVMPLIEGESLRSRLVRSGEFPVSDVAWILRDTAAALAYAHAHGVVHRDIKPDNILLNGNFAVVTDFGVAKAVSEATSGSNVTSAGVALGTPTYMAPEQAAADPNTDHRADIYALGIVGYELLAGTPPFTGSSPQMILAAHVTRTPDNVTTHRASVPSALANVIMRCLEKKPGDRWQSADELVQQLSMIATPGAMTPHATAPHVAASYGKQDSGRSRRPAIAAAFILGLAAVAGIAWFARRDRAVVFDDRHVIVSDFDNQTRDPSLDPIGKLASDLLRQGIAQTGVGEVVAAASVDKEATRPGLIVRGSYYKEGDSVRIQTEVLDARTSRVVRAFSPVTAPASNPSIGLERLRPRVLGALASLNDPLIRNWARKATEPPIYEAYRAYRAGLEADLPRMGGTAGVDGDNVADREFQRAIELDSTFVLPLLETLSSVFKIRYDARDRLTSVDRALIELRQAALSQEWDAAYKAGRQAVELAPDPLLLIQMADFTIFSSRPHEALAALKKADPDGQLKFGWGIRTDGLHLTGDLQSELAAVEREKQLGLATDFEYAQVLPALGRVAEVNALMNDRMRRPSRAEDTPAALMVFAAREYRAHGFLDASNDLANRAVAWYMSRPNAELTDDREENIFSALFHAGRYAEARDRLRKLAWKPDEGLGIFGRLAAHLGDTAGARNYMERLRKQNSKTAYQRALIAAALGDRELTYTLLQQAFAEGLSFGPFLHREFDIKAMENYPPIHDLLWPKG
ncbi:MAG: serine/threonine-protein kinase [Gemmatimonadaceae bacterium]